MISETYKKPEEYVSAELAPERSARRKGMPWTGRPSPGRLLLGMAPAENI